MRSSNEVARDRRDAFEDAERSVATLLLLLLIALLVVLATLIPAVHVHFGLSTRAAALGTGAIVLSVAVATIAHRLAGTGSRLYRFLEQLETVIVQVALAAMARTATGGAPLFWLLFLVHAMVAGHAGLSPALTRLSTLAIPAAAGLHAAVTSAPLAAVLAFASGLSGLFLVIIGQGTARRVNALTEERERLAAALTALEVEKERRRIARDLHDGIAGDLSALTVRLEDLRQGVSDEELRKGLEVLHGRTTGSIDELRSIVWALRAPDRELEELASYAELRCRELCPRDVRLTFRVLDRAPDAIPFSGHFCLSVVRMLQELVRNASRHATPTSIDVELLRGPDLEVIVHHDGAPHLADTLQAVLALREGGLANLRQRVRELSGQASFDAVDAGLRVHVTLPPEGSGARAG